MPTAALDNINPHVAAEVGALARDATVAAAPTGPKVCDVLSKLGDLYPGLAARIVADCPDGPDQRPTTEPLSLIIVAAHALAHATPAQVEAWASCPDDGHKTDPASGVGAHRHEGLPLRDVLRAIEELDAAADARDKLKTKEALNRAAKERAQAAKKEARAAAMAHHRGKQAKRQAKGPSSTADPVVTRLAHAACGDYTGTRLPDITYSNDADGHVVVCPEYLEPAPHGSFDENTLQRIKPGVAEAVKPAADDSENARAVRLGRGGAALAAGKRPRKRPGGGRGRDCGAGESKGKGDGDDDDSTESSVAHHLPVMLFAPRTSVPAEARDDEPTSIAVAGGTLSSTEAQKFTTMKAAAFRDMIKLAKFEGSGPRPLGARVVKDDFRVLLMQLRKEFCAADPDAPQPQLRFHYFSPDAQPQHKFLVALEQLAGDGGPRTVKQGTGVCRLDSTVWVPVFMMREASRDVDHRAAERFMQHTKAYLGGGSSETGAPEFHSKLKSRVYGDADSAPPLVLRLSQAAVRAIRDSRLPLHLLESGSHFCLGVGKALVGGKYKGYDTLLNDARPAGKSKGQSCNLSYVKNEDTRQINAAIDAFEAALRAAKAEGKDVELFRSRALQKVSSAGAKSKTTAPRPVAWFELTNGMYAVYVLYWDDAANAAVAHVLDVGDHDAYGNTGDKDKAKKNAKQEAVQTDKFARAESRFRVGGADADVFKTRMVSPDKDPGPSPRTRFVAQPELQTMRTALHDALLGGTAPGRAPGVVEVRLHAAEDSGRLLWTASAGGADGADSSGSGSGEGGGASGGGAASGAGGA